MLKEVRIDEIKPYQLEPLKKKKRTSNLKVATILGLVCSSGFFNTSFPTIVEATEKQTQESQAKHKQEQHSSNMNSSRNKQESFTIQAQNQASRNLGGEESVSHQIQVGNVTGVQVQTGVSNGTSRMTQNQGISLKQEQSHTSSSGNANQTNQANLNQSQQTDTSEDSYITQFQLGSVTGVQVHASIGEKNIQKDSIQTNSHQVQNVISLPNIN